MGIASFRAMMVRGSVMYHLGELLRVGVEVGCFGVGYLGRVDDSTVVGERSRGSVVNVVLGFGVLVSVDQWCVVHGCCVMHDRFVVVDWLVVLWLLVGGAVVSHFG